MFNLIRAPAWRLRCCRSGWPASTTSGGCSSTPTGISWRATPPRTGLIVKVEIVFFSPQVPPVLLQQREQREGQEARERHNAGDRHSGKAGGSSCGENPDRGGRRCGAGSPWARDQNQVRISWNQTQLLILIIFHSGGEVLYWTGAVKFHISSHRCLKNNKHQIFFLWKLGSAEKFGLLLLVQQQMKVSRPADSIAVSLFFLVWQTVTVSEENPKNKQIMRRASLSMCQLSRTKDSASAMSEKLWDGIHCGDWCCHSKEGIRDPSHGIRPQKGGGKCIGNLLYF